MQESRLYHNNSSCSKCRGALDLLRERGVEAEVIDLASQPPSEAQLRDLLRRIGCSPRDLLRTGEREYTALGLDRRELSDDEIIAAMATHPALIERPVFVFGERAVIGRPPERVLDLLDP